MDVSHRLSQRVGQFLSEKKCVLSTAESCTGGWIAEVVTSIPGSSAWFDRGFVTYSDKSKTEMLGVSAKLLEKHGAVSEEIVKAMATGALKHSDANISVAISGIAGPAGGSPTKPVGTIWLAWAIKDAGVTTRYTHFVGDREMVRQQAVMAALQGIVDVFTAREKQSEAV